MVGSYQHKIDAICMATHLLDDLGTDRGSLNQLHLEAQWRETPSGRSTITASLLTPLLEAAGSGIGGTTVPGVRASGPPQAQATGDC